MTLLIKGIVQKVGFRYSVVNHVLENNLPLVGFVRNLPDGSVQVIAQGDIESLKDLHRFCAKGPSRAVVRELTEKLEPVKSFDYRDFSIQND